MKRISFSEEAKADIRAIPQHIAMNILTAIHRLAQDGSGDVKTLRDSEGEKRLRSATTASVLRRKSATRSAIHAVKNRKDAYR